MFKKCTNITRKNHIQFSKNINFFIKIQNFFSKTVFVNFGTVKTIFFSKIRNQNPTVRQELKIFGFPPKVILKIAPSFFSRIMEEDLHTSRFFRILLPTLCKIFVVLKYYFEQFLNNIKTLQKKLETIIYKTTSSPFLWCVVGGEVKF